MRDPLAWLLPGLASSVVAGILLADALDATPLPARVAALMALTGAWLFRRRPKPCAMFAIALAFALGADAISSRLATARRDAPDAAFDAAVSGRICERVLHPRVVSVELCDLAPVSLGDRPAVERVPGRALLIGTVDTPEGAWLAERVPGDRVRAWLRFDAIGGARNPGAPDRGRSAGRHGFGARARMLDARLAAFVGEDRAGWGRLWRGPRDRIAGQLVGSGAGGPLLAALAVGDRRGLTTQDRDAFARLGISHLLAVSGLHLALVSAMAFAMSRALLLRSRGLCARADPRAMAAVAAVVVSLVYAFAVGWGVPVRRSWIFLAAVLSTLWVWRRAAPLHALAAAALFVALREPWAVFELGAQLSFVATAALVFGSSEARSAALTVGARMWQSLRVGLRVSATAIAATAPVLAAHGLSTPATGVAANTLAVPLTGLVLLPASLAAALAVALGDEGVVVPACEWIARAALEAVHAAVGGLPEVALATRRASWAVVLAGCAVVVLLRARSTGVRVLLCGVVCAGLTQAPAAQIEPGPPRIVVFAVGQGDAILIEGAGAAMLVDGGRAWAGGDLGRSIVVPALRALGVERLDIVVASHADADHRGGLPSVLDSFAVGEVWVPRGHRDAFPEIRAVARRRKISFRERGFGDVDARRGDLQVEFLWPPRPVAGRVPASSNETSLVLRVSVAGHSVLLTGDIGRRVEAALIESGRDLEAKILKVGHHGSAGSSSQAFLDAVGPDLALLSAGCGVHRRLPAPEVLQRLEAAAGSLWWTGRDGALALDLGLRGNLPTRTWGWRSDGRCRRR